MLHNEDNGAAARENSDVNAVHEGSGKQAAGPVDNFIPTSHLVIDLVHHAKTKQVMSRSLLGQQLTTVGFVLIWKLETFYTMLRV